MYIYTYIYVYVINPSSVWALSEIWLMRNAQALGGREGGDGEKEEETEKDKEEEHHVLTGTTRAARGFWSQHMAVLAPIVRGVQIAG